MYFRILTCFSECKVGEQLKDTSRQSWILSCRQTSPSSSWISWIIFPVICDLSWTDLSYRQWPPYDGGWLPQGRGEGRQWEGDQRGDQVQRVHQPEQQQQPGHSVITSEGEGRGVTCEMSCDTSAGGKTEESKHSRWFPEPRLQSSRHLLSNTGKQGEIMNIMTLCTFTGSSFSSWTQSSALFWYIFMVRFMFYLWVIRENWAGTCLASTGHPHLSPSGFKPRERKKGLSCKSVRLHRGQTVLYWRFRRK